MSTFNDSRGDLHPPPSPVARWLTARGELLASDVGHPTYQERYERTAQLAFAAVLRDPTFSAVDGQQAVDMSMAAARYVTSAVTGRLSFTPRPPRASLEHAQNVLGMAVLEMDEGADRRLERALTLWRSMPDEERPRYAFAALVVDDLALELVDVDDVGQFANDAQAHAHAIHRGDFDLGEGIRPGLQADAQRVAARVTTWRRELQIAMMAAGVRGMLR